MAELSNVKLISGVKKTNQNAKGTVIKKTNGTTPKMANETVSKKANGTALEKANKTILKKAKAKKPVEPVLPILTSKAANAVPELKVPKTSQVKKSAKKTTKNSETVTNASVPKTSIVRKQTMPSAQKAQRPKEVHKDVDAKKGTVTKKAVTKTGAKTKPGAKTKTAQNDSKSTTTKSVSVKEEPRQPKAATDAKQTGGATKKCGRRTARGAVGAIFD